MAARKTGVKQRAAHLHEVARLYVLGKPQAEIARLTDRSPGQISRDLKALHAYWRQSALIDMHAAIGEHLERLAVMERELWEAWERSMGESQETFTESTDPIVPPTQPGQRLSQARAGTRKAAIRRRDRTGNPAYMAQLLAIAQERAKLLGLYPSEKRNLSVTTATVPLSLLHLLREDEKRERAAPEAELATGDRQA